MGTDGIFWRVFLFPAVFLVDGVATAVASASTSKSESLEISFHFKLLFPLSDEGNGSVGLTFFPALTLTDPPVTIPLP
ncbi:hypothetical protein A2U01_0074815 [Trifolium medium]|uniref:Uncharacterized protein n=1 Tax=Trifolium medium TaxID=97028 RepID=A0A392SXK1_9FABA|nr:hypothetical protein [Trifolium medium]